MSDQLLTAEEVADLLQVKASWVYAAARKDEIPYVQVGRYVRFDREALTTWISARTRRP